MTQFINANLYGPTFILRYMFVSVPVFESLERDEIKFMVTLYVVTPPAE